MTAEFSDRVLVVTGGTQGLGEAIAVLFAERGASGIVVTGRNKERGAHAAQRLSQLGAKAIFVPAELARMEDCRAVLAAARETFGEVHHLVNAAGITKRGTILDTTPALFDEIMAVNVRAPFFLMQDAIRLMIETGTEGTIVNILSTAAHCGAPVLSPYSTSKAALALLTKNTAFALLKNRIRVNGLAIGWMDTPGEDAIQRAAHGAGDGWLESAEARQPFGRLLKPDEVARAVAFLSSAESGMMTGAIVDFDQTVNGGWEVQPAPSAAMTLSDAGGSRLA
jgi:NAD(P)-dependent dehydrogenase (short-subunit alcohol dehydrogenase family)